MMSEIKEALGPVLKVLGELGGRFTFTDDEGRQFVVVSQEEWEKLNRKEPEAAQKPLPLAAAPAQPRSFVVRSRADELLDRINREIALFQTEDPPSLPEELEATEGRGEQSQDDLEITPEQEQASLRVKFEPLRGDLPPNLQ